MHYITIISLQDIMTEETKSSEESIEEEIVEEITEDDKNNTENVENIEFEDADSNAELPLDYEKKLGKDEEEEIEEPFVKRNIKKAITYLDGKSRRVVTGTLIVFSISIINFITWNFTHWENLQYLGTFLSFILLLACAAGILISYNVYNSDLVKNNDIRLSGLILSSGSVLATIFFMLYEVSQNPCLLELSEKNCDFVKVDSLRSVTTVAVYSGSLGVVMLIYGLGLLKKPLIPYALAIAFGGSLILTIVLLMSAFKWIEDEITETYGHNIFVRDWIHYFFDLETLKKRNVPLSEPASIIKKYLLRVEGIKQVFTKREIMEGDSTDKIMFRLQKMIHPELSPDVVTLVSPGYLFRTPHGTSHGTPYDYDTHVPLIISRTGRASKQISERSKSVDIAPTIAKMLGIEIPVYCDGVPLKF